MSEKTLNVKAKASRKGDATSGQIIVLKKDHEFIIPAVVFTATQSSIISRAVDEAYNAAVKSPLVIEEYDD